MELGGGGGEALPERGEEFQTNLAVDGVETEVGAQIGKGRLMGELDAFLGDGRCSTGKGGRDEVGGRKRVETERKPPEAVFPTRTAERSPFEWSTFVRS